MNRAEAKQKAQALVAQMDVLEAAAQLSYDAPALDRLHIPEYNWWNEALHGVARAGVATSFPQAIAMAASFDQDEVQHLGEIASTEGRAKYNALSQKGDRDIYKGLTFWSPNINIFRDPRWGRGHETYGEDPYLTTQLGLSYIRGLQGQGEYLRRIIRCWCAPSILPSIPAPRPSGITLMSTPVRRIWQRPIFPPLKPP